MANRRSILGAGLSSLGDSLGGFFQKKAQDDMLLKRQIADDERAREQAEALEKKRSMDQILAKVLEKNPVTAAREAGVTIDPRDQMAGVLEEMGKSDRPDKLMTEEELTNRFRSAGGNAPDNFSPASGDLANLQRARTSRQTLLDTEANKPNQIVYEANDDGSKRALGVNPRTMGAIQTEPTSVQQGKNEASKKLNGDLSAPVVGAEVNKAGRIAGAQASAAEPFKDPTIMYGDDGQGVGLKYNPKTKQYDSVPLPTGVTGKTPPKSLTQSEVENVASLNTAEIEGVKVLSQIHKLGLDKSNDPMDPRWTKFVVGTLKMAPGDYQRADVQQRAAYVKAALTRALMGARPSQYVAKIIQEHIPDGNMTGEQLVHVMSNVMEQVGEKRNELANVSGRKIPGPAQGGYEAYRKAIQDEADPIDSALAILRARKAGLTPMAPMPSHKVGG